VPVRAVVRHTSWGPVVMKRQTKGVQNSVGKLHSDEHLGDANSFVESAEGVSNIFNVFLDSYFELN
jgi:hypothetical protein